MQEQCNLGAADSRRAFPTSMFSSSSSSSLPEDSSSASFSHLINGSALTRISLASSFETYFFEAWKTETSCEHWRSLYQTVPKYCLNWNSNLSHCLPQPVLGKEASRCTSYTRMEKPDSIGYLQVFNCYSTLHTALYLFCPAKDDFFFQKICIIHFLQNMWYFRNKLRLMHGYHTLKAMEKVPLRFLVVVAELELW